MRAQLLTGLCIFLATCTIPAAAQEPPAAGPAHRLIIAKNVDKLQEELDRAAADGYAVALGWPGYAIAILTRRAEGGPRPEYRVFNGEKAIQQGLAQGYRAVPDTLDVYGDAPLVIARKAVDAEKSESLLLRAHRTATLDKEVREAAARGFRVIGMASNDSGHSVLLERAAGTPPDVAGADVAALIAVSRQDSLQSELASRAAAGYRIAQSSCWNETLLSLERRHAEKPPEYRVLSAAKSTTLEQEIGMAATEGFRYTPGTLHAVQKSVPLFGAMSVEYLAIMEKAADDVSREYFLVSVRRVKTLAQEFDDAVARGFTPVALSLPFQSQEALVLFEREQR
jgi:hypothetical protein